MSIQQKYFMYHTVFELVKNRRYEIIHINTKIDEAWVQKKEKGNIILLRFFVKNFDFENHMKQDIASVFNRVQLMNRIFRNKNVTIHNIYVADRDPIDSLEKFKKPIYFNQKKKTKMNVYYIGQSNQTSEINRLFENMNQTKFTYEINDVSVMQYKVRVYKTFLQRQIYEMNKKIRTVFTYGKPSLTYLFLILNLIMFFLLEANGGSTNIHTLIQYGANLKESILDGEWWRFISAGFLHIGFIHFFLNMLALFYIGQFVERIYGTKGFFIIYMFSLLLGNVASFAFTDAVSAGASGAIFGLFGSLLYFGTKYKELFLRTIGMNVILILLINLIIGFIVPQVDMLAHLGGLIGGFLAGAIATLPYKRDFKLQLISFVIYCIVLSATYMYGFTF